MTGCEESVAREEVNLTIQRLFHWGAYADKYGGTVQVSELFVLTRNTNYRKEIFSFVDCL